MHPGCLLVWCLLATQNFDTSREVYPWLSECHIQQEQADLDYFECYHSQMVLESERCYFQLFLQIHLPHPAPC